MKASLFLLISQLFIISHAWMISKPTGKVICWHYKRELLPDCSNEPGWHFYNPITTEPQLVDVVLQTDYFGPYNCKNIDRELVIFPEIKVSNQLPKERVFTILQNFEKFGEGIPYDRKLIQEPVENWVTEQCTLYTGEELQTTEFPNLNERLRAYLIEFQSKHKLVLNGEETGLRFPELGVMLKQPKLHKDVEDERQKVAKYKAEQLSQEAERQVTIAKEETAKTMRLMQAEAERQEAEVKNKKAIEQAESEAKRAKIQKESEAEQSKILAESSADTVRRMADANRYSSSQQALANNELYGSQEAYVKVLSIQAISNDTKIYYGDKLPSYVGASFLT